MTTEVNRESWQQLADQIKTGEQQPKYTIRTFGCQQNVSDSQRIAGLLESCGYAEAASIDDADLIVFNTCAVREHAEDRVFGNVGEIKHLKAKNKTLMVALGGCMVQQPHIADKLRSSYPFVDILFNTNELHRLPGHILNRMLSQKSVLAAECADYAIYEGVPIKRDQDFRAFVPVMYGCDNFCSYCVVPLVRGRERSREPAEILAEFRDTLRQGYKDIMLLGQNVNSYGKRPDDGTDFSALLRLLAAEEGDYVLRFMTSHPKDATKALFDTIARHPRISRHIHLPVQSGSDAILGRMNRRYSVRQYLDLIDYARKVIPNVTFSSDIIVGFPGETRDDFLATLKLVEQVRFNALFTFIYSKRVGTPAADMDDGVTHRAKTERMAQLLALQDNIERARLGAMIGKEYHVLATARDENGAGEARMDDNSTLVVDGIDGINQYYHCKITSIKKKTLHGKVIANT